MTRFLVGTDSTETSEKLRTYLETALDAGDAVCIINSLIGGDETSTADVETGEAAIETLVDTLASRDVEITTHQYVRGNEPIEDLLRQADEWDADEYIIGIRKRTPVGKLVFGSTAQNLLLEADRPVRCVPQVSE